MLRECQLSKLQPRISGIKKAIEQKPATFQKLNGNVVAQRLILTITKWFIGKLKPNYCEKVPLENKQFALFLVSGPQNAALAFLYLRLVPTIHCIMRACFPLPISATQSLAFLWILFFQQPLRKSNGLNEPERKWKERKRDVWGKINGFTLYRSRRKARQQGLYLLKWLLFGREARGKNAPSW